MSLGVIYKKVVGLEQRTSELEGQVKILMSMNKKINFKVENDECTAWFMSCYFSTFI